MADDLIKLEVAYAKPDKQIVIPLGVTAGNTVRQAIEASGILEQFPDIDLNRQKVGIFGQICTPDKIVVDGDRVEIYRALLQNPMDARRGRLQK